MRVQYCSIRLACEIKIRHLCSFRAYNLYTIILMGKNKTTTHDSSFMCYLLNLINNAHNYFDL